MPTALSRAFTTPLLRAPTGFIITPEIFSIPKKRATNFVKWGGNFRQKKPIVEIAVYYPETDIQLHGNKLLPLLQPLRDRFDFAYMSDGQIRDGGLKTIKALILMQGTTAEAANWRRIIDWMRSGGVVLYADGLGKLRSVEGDTSFHDALFGANAQRGKGRVAVFNGAAESATYRAFLASTLAKAPELSATTRAMIAADGKENGLFVTVTAPGELMWFNESDAGKTQQRRGAVRGGAAQRSPPKN